MARPAAEILTDREAEIMNILWELQMATSDDVRKRMAGTPHDSTVRTLLRVLVKKGYVKVEPRSRPARYGACVAQLQVQKKAARGLLLRFFGGSAESLVLRLLEDEHLTPQQLQELKAAHAKSRAKRGK